jgi:cytochrome c oxidase assembly protein subunit 20
MADDTRQSDAQTTTPARPKGPANTMPGGTAHTAGGTPADDSLSYWDVVRTLDKNYYLTFHQRPCVRDSLLNGIPAGFAGGALAAVVRRM